MAEKKRKTTAARQKVTDVSKNNNDTKRRPIGPFAAVAVIAAALMGNCSAFGPGMGPGLLPGGSGRPAEESGVSAGSTAQEMVSSTAAAVTTEAVTTEETSSAAAARFIEVTINEDGFLYKNQKCTLEAIFADIAAGDEIHYTVRRASKDDVDDLLQMAKEKGVKTVKEE